MDNLSGFSSHFVELVRYKRRGLVLLYLRHGNGSENSDFKYHIGKGLEPFKWNWDGETSTLYENCRNGGKGVQDHAF